MLKPSTSIFLVILLSWSNKPAAGLSLKNDNGISKQINIRRWRHLDPEIDMNASELITSKGYPCEEYTVKTGDGYLLGIQRIPFGSKNSSTPRPVAFLQHGLLCTSTNWLTNLPNESLAFILADAGYDVWLGNVRGNTYSRRHVNYSVNSEEFWAFSWDHHASSDLPAMVNFVLNKTGQSQLHYIGHSQGTLMAFAHMSTNPEFAKKLKGFYALGPVATVGHMKSIPLKILSDIPTAILYDMFGKKDFLPNNELIDFLAKTVCDEATRFICSDIIFVIAGYDKAQLNMTRLPVYIAHTPAGTSAQNMIHFQQMVIHGEFRMFDYGSPKANREHYNGQSTPPYYDARKVQAPTYLYYGGKDLLADPQDVKSLMALLPNLKGSQLIPSFDHLDFIWGMDAYDFVYKNVIEAMKSLD
ncbi:gastric triacylglycerol lipase isoform X2 [Lingula anatina]|uniref:Lipase n=1 Tax=Lingula anatina TaxID=7574 RepID=A0A1S3H4P9_LINAN|nr:gastric triacylglycerol lipase isoform X1 [Lingula anatina]XP_013380110.1 gastric triacylglycerol lipase isoform X2 [Lingula anatina]|eukprot:XP_013380109.1 gastric triacylglycerol lipase isoform X1 [Lingula anatina]